MHATSARHWLRVAARTVWHVCWTACESVIMCTSRHTIPFMERSHGTVKKKNKRGRERERVVWRALVAPHSLCQILWCVGFQSLSMSIPACVPCWNGPMCRWHRVGACRFGHSDESELHVQHDGLRALSTEVQELRSALRRLAAHVMWHNGAVVGSQQKPTGERSSARTSGTTPSLVHQTTRGVQWMTSPQDGLQHDTQRRRGQRRRKVVLR